MNPGTNGSPTVKPNTSASIAAAAKQIVEKARESAPLSSYTTNHTPQGSPERSLIKGAHHKRMQSLQPGSVKDLRSYLDGNRSPERSPERQSYMTASRQTSTESLTSTPDRSATPTPSSRDALRDTPMLRPSARQPPRAILGENTPPSATMLALQTMQVPDVPLSDVTNGPSTPTGTKLHTNLDFSSQLLNLTTIATNLQKEMAQLSRRSKDNATDLISLKEATNARDEDIRKSLRDLATSVNTTQVLLGPPPVLPTNRRGSGFGSSFMGDKLFSSPPSASAAYAMPRSQSAHGFLEEPRCGSPSPYSVEGAASVAMLEKIIREMVTKEGHDRLLTTLSELVEKSSKENVDAARKIEQLSNLIKEKSGSQALVHVPGGDNRPFDSPRGLGGNDRGSANIQTSSLNDDIYKMLQRIKDSVANSGGMTSEVKGLVRDMRGEVLGTGRELGQKLDKLLEEQAARGNDRSGSDHHDSELSEEIHRIVEDGISDLKAQLSQMIQQRNEQDDDTFRQLASTRSMPNGDEMLSVVQHALAEHSRSLDQRDAESVGPGLDRDGVLDAVKEGLKDFEPNIELQQFGLERDEILAVLKEGLEDYQNNRPESTAGGLDKGEIYEVMQEALKDFQSPLPDAQITQMKEELIEAVRQALAEFQPSPQEPHVDHEAMHGAVLDAVREGFANQGPAAPRELEISRDDLFDAVKASLDGSSIPFGGLGEQVLEQLHELIDGMRAEFKQYSAANGRDTEQVLDAVKDGLESLRAEIETYVDRAQDVTGKDEIVDTVKGGLEQLRSDIQGYCLQGPAHDGGKAEMLEYIKAEFEHLHETINDNHGESSRGLDDDKPNHTAEIILAINEGMQALKSHVETRSVDRSIDDPSLDDLSDAMRVEFEQLKGALLQANAADKNELLETIQDSIGALHTRLNGSEIGSSTSASSAELTQIIQEELSALKESIHAIVSDVDTEAIVSGVRQSIDELRTQIAADQSDSSAEIIGTIKEELERFNESIGSSVVVGHNPEGHKEALDAIRAGLEDVKATTVAHGSRGISDDQLEAIRGEFENIRNAIANNSMHSGSHDEVMDAVRLGLDDLRSHLDKKLDNPEAMMSHQEEIIDALNDGLDNLRGDIIKTLDKPLDMTVNYEILDTLKDGLAGLRASMDKLAAEKDRPITPRGGEIVLAEAGEVGQAREVPAAGASSDGIKRTDLEKMEVLLAQLQIKVEAMDHTIQELPAQQTTPSAPADAVVKEDLVSIEAMIRDLQETVGASTSRGMDSPESVARKEDTDAIETLLRNTKAQLDDMAANPVSATTKEQLDEIHAVLRATNESLDTLSDKLENSAASKTDVAVVEVLAQDLKTVLDELKEKVSSDSSEEKPEVVTKSDIDVLGVLVTEVKANVAELNERAPEQLSKADFEALQLMIADFRESHDKLKDSYETDIAVTAKAFDDRKREFDDTLLQISEVKNMLDEIKVEVLEKLNDGEVGINTLGVALKGIEANTSNEQATSEIKEFIDTVKEEFERAHSSLEALKSDHAQASESSLEKQSEHKETLITELTVKLDALFDGLMSKYDDAQLAAEEKARAMEDKAMEQEQLMNVTKALADDLKLSIDTLGTTLSAFMGDLPATVEKMAEENKTVFAQVEKTHSKLEETAETLRDEHASTRDQVAKILAAVDCVQGDLTENHPRIMVTLEEVRALITQHYTHSQSTAEAAAEHAKAVKELQDALKAGFEDTRATAESLRSQNEELKTTLPALMPPPIEAPREVEKYDDTAVHDKLDKLMGHLEETSSRSDHMERLDQIHEKVMATAAEVSAFVVAQNKQITANHENKEKEAEELALLLERRLERKDQLEADITVLNEEKESLQHAVEALKAEKEAMLAQKARLNADLSSMETALHIRRDELHEMDEKAHAIERRMMEGVMNQSRMFLLSKSAKPTAPKKKPQGRDLRIPSDGSVMSGHTVTSTVPSTLKTGHALAMRSARAPVPRNGGAANTAERRIMSLNHISHNQPPITTTLEKPSLLAVSGNGLANMKRSQSVKNAAFHRKTSWAPGKRNVSISSSIHNKENEETLSEEDEEYSQATESRIDDLASDVGTEQHYRHSVGDTDARDSMSYATGSYLSDGEEGEHAETETDDRRTSYGTYDSGTGSYLTQSELDRHPSVGSSAKGTLGTSNAAAVPEDMLSDLEPPPRFTNQGMVKFAPPSDSGLGTDLQSGQSGAEEEYVRRR